MRCLAIVFVKIEHLLSDSRFDVRYGSGKMSHTHLLIVIINKMEMRNDIKELNIMNLFSINIFLHST